MQETHNFIEITSAKGRPSKYGKVSACDSSMHLKLTQIILYAWSVDQQKNVVLHAKRKYTFTLPNENFVLPRL